jgi:hypothetical protein
MVETLETSAGKRVTKSPLSNAEAASVRRTIDNARRIIGGKTSARVGRLTESKSFSTSPARILEMVMSLTDEPRLNLTKGFDYYDQPHFSGHVKCVARGVSYSWLAYETDTLKAEWRSYLQELEEELALEHLDMLKQRLKKPVDLEAIKALLDKQVKCHVYPKRALQPVEPIPFRITIFGGTIGVCSEESAPYTYPHGSEAIVLRGAALERLREALASLYQDCRPAQATHTERLKKGHDELREAFFQALVEKL